MSHHDYGDYGAAHRDESSNDVDGGTTANHDQYHANRDCCACEPVGGPMSDVTIQVPTAHGVLSAAPPVEATADDVIRHMGRTIAALEQQLVEKDIALGTICNIAACALKVMADMGLEDAPGEFAFSHDLTDRMYGTNLTLSEDFAGGIRVRFAERTTAPVLLER